jgi:hypothetical protein
MQGGLPSCFAVYHAASAELGQMLDRMAAVLMHCAKPVRGYLIPFCQLRLIVYGDDMGSHACMLCQPYRTNGHLKHKMATMYEMLIGELGEAELCPSSFCTEPIRIKRYSSLMLFIWVRVARSRRHRGRIKATVVDSLLDAIQAGSEENQRAISYSLCDSGCNRNVSSRQKSR